MSGEQLVRHLQSLGAPGAEHLVGEAYDWLFVKGKDDPLVTFLQWFMKNITPNNVMTEEELAEFEALKAAGEVLSPTQLQEMEGALSSIPSLPGASEQGQGELLPSPEELKALEDELEILTQRKNMINAHKIELLNETQQLSKRLQKTQSELRRQVEAASTTSYHFNKAQQNLAGVVDTHLNTFHNFDQAGEEEAVFLSQVDLEEWHREEDKFTNLLTTYIQKQFREGVGVVAGTEDCSQYVLLDVNNLELSLVRGAGEDQYRRNVAELRRLNALLPQTEDWRLRGMIQQERRKAEVMEAEKLLAALHQGHLPSDLTVLKQQTQEVEESLTVVEKESRHQQQTMQAVLTEVAELESTKTISGDYELKLQRQGYFLTKQIIVMEQLVSQVARYNWVIIALQTEGHKLTNMMDMLRMVNTRITERDASYKRRMIQLEATLKKSEEDKASGVLPLPLHTLACLLPPQGQSRAKAGSKELLLKQVDGLLTGLSVAQEQVATITSPQFSCLTQMMSICEALEASLFGTPGSLQALPLAWLESVLAHRCTAAEQKVWEFKQKLINIISQYEKKKKILQIDPTVNQEFKKWIADVLRKFK
ncbi:hypothetical protein O3P69_006987 [Scylla paramamosain]|uniref:HAUS augmin-like complex subunit 3 N-terminal domain-containing protein n=1 Tax=Scylla paramamosain TaxID=85552 RepID=A0AAW0V0T8_SCYPA